MSKISICIFTYNRAKMIESALKSSLYQNYNDYEIIIVDDGSTDNTKIIIDRYKSDKIKYFRQINKGRPFARNKCIEEASGEYIIWLGSDDCLKKDALTSYDSLLSKNSDIDIYYGKIIVTDQNFKKLHIIEYEDWHKKNVELLKKMVWANMIPDGGSLIRKDLYTKYGFYNTYFKQSQDYEWFSRVSEVAKFKYTAKENYYWRSHNGDRASNSNGQQYDSLIVQNLVNKHTTNIFLTENEAKTLPNTKCLLIGSIRYSLRLLSLNDNQNAAKILISALKFTNNNKIKSNLIHFIEKIINK